jgi:SMI1-KNR4 cell-wall
LPQRLRELLEETDGLRGEYGLEVVFSAEEIARQNHAMRTTDGFDELYMPFDCLLFFGAEGGGDLYAFPILAGGADDLHVFVWDHETDSRTATASGLAGYLRGERWAEP